MWVADTSKGPPSACADTEFLRLIGKNQKLHQLLDRFADLELPDTWLVGGCLFQTAWNVMAGHAPDRGIRDYDIFYFDPQDCTRESEEAAGRRVQDLYTDTGCVVDVRNQARVHAWFAEEFGVSGYPRLEKATDGIDNFLAVCCMVGVRRLEDGCVDLYAPLGVGDVLSYIMRPNPLSQLASRDAYDKKAGRWHAAWPALQVMPHD